MTTDGKEAEKTLTIVDRRASAVEAPAASSVTMVPSLTSPLELVAQALEKGVDTEQLQQLLDLQFKWQAEEARKAYVRDLAAFRADAPVVAKDARVEFESKRGGSDTSYDHASLGQVLSEAGKAMSTHGFSHQWSVEQVDKSIKVTCRLTHREGHWEETAIHAPPDSSGNKNPIQQIGSTVTYLQRYTLLALLGLATASQDDDGQRPSRPASRPETRREPASGQKTSSENPAPQASEKAPQKASNGGGKGKQLSQADKIKWAEETFRHYGVLLADLTAKLGESDRWGDNAFAQIKAWHRQFKPLSAKGRRRLAYELFELEPGALDGGL
jgi:hypothetical protein